jgi:murein DD-endopeptidase MepM/ murein hydrolase activator NlpD
MLATLHLTAVALLLWVVVPVGAADAPPDPSPPAASVGSYAWPVHGPVLRRFDPPDGPYGAGHRGIDVGVPAGTPVRAAQGGTVAFAGRVAGQVHVSIDHPDGVRTSYSYLERSQVRAGDAVLRGSLIGASGGGHAGAAETHLHFGARYAGEYIDPLLLLERTSVVDLIRLAPLDDEG